MAFNYFKPHFTTCLGADTGSRPRVIVTLTTKPVIMASPPFNFDNEEDDVVEDELPEEVITPLKPADEISDRFRRDIEKAQDLEHRLGTLESKEAKKEERQKFVNNNLDWWRRKTHDNSNFLHFLARYDDRTKPSLHLIMARAITKMTAEMGMMDKDRYTPLTLALLHNNYQFVHATCKNVSARTQESIGEALRSECEGQETERATTCLHEAISWRQHYEFIKIIIGFAPKAMFSARDAKGRTPLHLAVEYDRCCAAQVGLVKELLLKGPAAMNVKIPGEFDSSTVYQYHERTRREAEDKIRMKPPATQSKEQPQQEKKEYKEAEFKKERTDTIKAAKPDITKDKMESHGPNYSAKRRDSLSAAPTPTGTDSGKPSNLSLVNTRLAQGKGPQGFVVETQQSASNTQASAERTENDEERMRSSDEIRGLLKLFYLREKRPQEAVAHLHVQHQRGM